MKSIVWPLLLLLALSACRHSPGEHAGSAAMAPAPGGIEAARPLAADVALELPATFSGVLPCADCPGIHTQLTLRPDGVFQLRRDWLERDFSLSDLGRWRRDPQRGAIMLEGDPDEPLQFEAKDPRTIRLLDTAGQPIVSELPYNLNGDGTVRAFTLRLSGAFRYLADAARFSTCSGTRSWPVAMEGAYLDLERAYMAAAKPEPGAPLAVTLDARIEDRAAMDGNATVPTLVVEGFIGLAEGQECGYMGGTAALTETYWRIVELAGEHTIVGDHEEAHLILRADEPRYAATAGCNRLMGSWKAEGERISFGNGATTMMACWPPLDAQEARLKQVLQDARRWRIDGQMLEFSNDAGKTIAVFEAVYLR